MSSLQHGSDLKSYLNPVYRKSFPDPFVLKYRGKYFAYSTGFASDGNVFSVISSVDLVNWSEIGGAMKPLDPSPPYYWAPEATFDNGKFYLYYSVGNETFMQIRVAVSDRPDGGFIDSENCLTIEDFAIDAHVFVDDDGLKYLFYATDFLKHSHIGTGTVVDRMIDWFTLEGNPQPVTQAQYDWQIYDPNRKEKGGVRWHTVEGPAVLKRKGLYYEMFSGGNWQNSTYGVSFAVSRQIHNPDGWHQFCDGEIELPILRTIPDTVIGPGHNSVVCGPNNRELYCVYHRWIDEKRVMAIDRMDFAGERIFVVGASHTPQPAPFEPSLDGFDHEFSRWKKTGDWSVENSSARSAAIGRSEIEMSDLPQSFLCVFTFRCSRILSEHGSVGINLYAGQDNVGLTFHPGGNVIRIEIPEDSAGLPSIFKLDEDFDWSAEHLLRIDADYRRLRIGLDTGPMAKIDTCLTSPLRSFSIFTDNQSVAITSFQLTEGFEELFDVGGDVTDNGWDVTSDGSFRVESGELRWEAVSSLRITKHPALPACEFAANFRVYDQAHDRAEFGLLLSSGEADILRFSIDAKNRRFMVNGRSVSPNAYGKGFTNYHQLRIIKTDTAALCYFDDVLVHTFRTDDSPTIATVFGHGVQLGIEMIRLTAI